MKRIGLLLLKILGIFLLVVLVFLSFSVAPIDRTLPQEQAFYQEMMDQIDNSIDPLPVSDTTRYEVGFAKRSITPSFTTATAGYVKRKGKHFTSIRDSVFVRTMIVKQADLEVALVSLDMLIVPPILYHRLEEALKVYGFPMEQVYLGTTHTHNSVGNWDDHLVGEIYAGNFNSQLIDYLVQQMVTCLDEARNDIQRASLRYGVIPVREAVSNRLIKNGPVDSLFHLIEIVREDGSKGIVASYSAHATCMPTADLRLSRDYPGALVDQLETLDYSFALFMAGAVGSHAPMSMKNGEEKINAMANRLSLAVPDIRWEEIPADGLKMVRIPLQLGQQQIKILPGWRVREWLSLPLLGESNPALTLVKIGNLVLLGTPCDFSGLLTGPVYKKASEKNVHVMVTSFNGGYIGYITPDEYYDLEKYETQTMNWYGPGNGTYMQQCMMRMLDNIAR
jgi:hypothetical protein